MEPISGSRAEAERWLVIAEKLLTSRDLVGSKSFAIRARESDPRLEYADRILVVADTLLAGEKRVNNDQPDWYAILQLPNPTHDMDLIANQYRRLALLLNPFRNKLAFADEALKLVNDAWLVLKKSNELNPFLNRVQEQQQQQQQQEQQQQQQQTVRPNPRNVINPNVENIVPEEPPKQYNHSENSSFWTACPYCYTMYEYSRVYEDCTLRCQNCRRAFHGVVVSSPPTIVEGKEAYFSCWGFFPIGGSMSNFDKNKGGVSNWAPFSQMQAFPQVVNEGNVAAPKPKKASVRKSSGPRIYVDDDDVFVGISEPSEDSDDDEWGSTRKKKKARKAKGKGSAGKNVGKAQTDKGKSVEVGGGENLQGGSAMQEGMGVPNATNAETSKKVVASNTRKQTGRKVARELGKLDLNVEFSNEVEEPVLGMNEGNGGGNGVEDGIEGTGFFEGLDEFLSSLPILSVVGDDKVKAT